MRSGTSVLTVPPCTKQKKVVLLINGIVLVVHDVCNRSSQVTLNALKEELQRLGFKPDDFKHIITSTSDGAATQAKFKHLLQKKANGTVFEKKCAMHLEVNL